MGGSNSSRQEQNIANPQAISNLNPPIGQGMFHSVVNRLADANPDLGASVLAQRRRFQCITQINLAASIQRKTVSLVPDEVSGDYTVEFKYDTLKPSTLCIMECVKEDSAHKLTW